MILTALLSTMAPAAEIAISPLTAVQPFGDFQYDFAGCPYAVGNSLLFEGEDGAGNAVCGYTPAVVIPLSGFVTGRELVAITVCYETRFGVGSLSAGVSFEISESVGAAVDAPLWADGLWRTADPGVCEVIPVGIWPSGTPMLEISVEQGANGLDEDTYIGQIWMTVGK